MTDAHEVLVLLVKHALGIEPEVTNSRLNEHYMEYKTMTAPASDDVDVATQLQQAPEPPKENA
jgi:hypothetical protein